jgi:hypothetical protein
MTLMAWDLASWADDATEEKLAVALCVRKTTPTATERNEDDAWSKKVARVEFPSLWRRPVTSPHKAPNKAMARIDAMQKDERYAPDCPGSLNAIAGKTPRTPPGPAIPEEILSSQCLVYALYQVTISRSFENMRPCMIPTPTAMTVFQREPDTQIFKSQRTSTFPVESHYIEDF